MPFLGFNCVTEVELNILLHPHPTGVSSNFRICNTDPIDMQILSLCCLQFWPLALPE